MSVSIQQNEMGLLSVLHKTERKESKSAARLASGKKITSAGDDPAPYAISQKMRVQIRALAQAKQNEENGSSLMATAESAMQNIVENLKTMKELAVKAANGIYTTQDRQTIQKEFSSKLAEIEDISAEANFNGKVLLDGSYRNGELLDVDTVDKPTGRTVIIGQSAGTLTISADGVYSIADGYNGTINVEASNVLLKPAGVSSLSEVHINCATEGMNLWLSSVTIQNTTTSGSVVKFTGTGNVLHTAGDCLLNVEKNYSSVAVVDMGDELTVKNSDTLKITNGGLSSYGAGIGTNANAIGKRLTLQGGTFSVYGSGLGAGIGTGDGGQLDQLIIRDAELEGKTTDYGAPVGCGAGKGRVNELTISNCSGSLTDADSAPFGQNGLKNGKLGSVSVFSNTLAYDGTVVPNTPLNPLQMQTDSTAGKVTNFYLNAMTPKALGIDLLQLNTRDKAKVAVRRLDTSLQYALNQVTLAGAYQQRMEKMGDNLTTETENMTRAKSVICDADMAKEIVAYTKQRVLLQAGQSMLAQANQQKSNVLHLLQA